MTTALRQSARRSTAKKITATTAKKSITAAPKTQHIEWRGYRMTTFEKIVYELISTIPEGRVSTYGAIAKALSSGPRPVGQALRKNPLAPQVPCHRVVAGDLNIGGFKGTQGEDSPHICEKRQILATEGVTFTSDLKVDPSCVHEFD